VIDKVELDYEGHDNDFRLLKEKSVSFSDDGYYEDGLRSSYGM
jgi:hypothetical protein